MPQPKLTQGRGGRCWRVEHAAAIAGHSTEPRRIPQIIHQTGKHMNLTYNQQLWRSTWAYHNPDYEMRFYDNAGCLDFIAHEYPRPCPSRPSAFGFLSTRAARVGLGEHPGPC